MDNKKKVILGLSGGVDSAVAGLLLKQQGYQVNAVYLTCWSEPGCRAEADRNDAMKVALQLDIPFQVLDFRKEYKDKVMAYFYNEYAAGRTPNPDILCNSVIKFGLFYQWAIKEGYDYVATGHYARIQNSQKQEEKETYILTTPKDTQKDQTYFLYRLKKEQLSHILFPLGDYLKSEIRDIARENHLVVAEKKDSVGICFVGNVNVSKLLEERFGKRVGQIQLTDGTVVGEHDGHWFFTVGTRGRWRRNHKIGGQFKDDKLPKLYVIAIHKEDNVVVVGKREEALTDTFSVTDTHWLDSLEEKAKSVGVRIRNTGEILPALLEKEQKNITVNLTTPEFGVASGQSAVFYRSLGSNIPYFEVLGGGVIA